MDFWYALTHHNKNVAWEQLCEDFNKRYQHTLMKITDASGTKLRWIYNLSGAALYVYDTSRDRDRVKLDLHSIQNIEAFLPKVGYYQYDTGGCFLIKKIKRQWKRSFCPETYEVIYWGHCTPQMLLNAPSYPYALDELDVDSPTIAVSPEFKANFSNGQLCLYIQEKVIGYIKPNKKEIEVVNRSLAQEVSDFINKHRMHSWKVITIE